MKEKERKTLSSVNSYSYFRVGMMAMDSCRLRVQG